MNVDDETSGARVVWEGRYPIKADIIFVHGLSGHPIKTWSTYHSATGTKKRIFGLFSKGKNHQVSDAQGDGSVFWPRDLLPIDEPHVRIISFGYESDVLKMFTSDTTINHNNIFQHARNMLGGIQRVRAENPERPVVFVCHSLGGIITKEALRLSRRAEFQPNLQGLYKHTHGVIFLGTPHRGSTLAPWGALAGNLAKLAFQSPNVSLLKSLEVNSMALQTIADEFSSMIRRHIKVFSFREEKAMSGIYGLDGMIVDEFSAIIGDATEGKEGINANHVDMCKFASRQNDGYRKVSGEIWNFVNASPGVSSSSQNESGSNSTEKWPGFISAEVRQKILRDKPYNHIDFMKHDGTPTVTLPVLDIPALSAPIRKNAPKTLYLGNSAFELVDVLQLLPEHANHNLLSTEDIPLAHLIVDQHNYYTRISQEGILRLACQHFHSLYEADNGLFIRTTIGTFQFTHTERGNVVHFTAREKSTFSIAPENQDFHSVQQSALGRYCFRENLNDDYFKARDISPGPPIWRRIKPHDVIASSDLNHNDCIRFMTAEHYGQFQKEDQFAEISLQEAFDVLERRPKHFDDYTKEGLGVVKIMSKKALRSAEHLAVSVAAAKWVLSGVCRMPPDPPIPRKNFIANASGTISTFHGGSEIVNEIADDMQEDFETTVISEHVKRNVADGETTDKPKVETGSQNDADTEAIAQRLLANASRELEILWSLYHTAASSDSLLRKIQELGESQSRLLAALMAVQIIYLTNSKIIRAVSVPAPQRWLDLLGSADADILIQ